MVHGAGAQAERITRPEQIELYDPDVYVRGVPHEAFKYLRQNEPVYFHPEPGGPGFWALTKYDDIVEVSRNPMTFSSRMGTNIEDYSGQDLVHVQLLLVNMDPPQHVKFRRLVRKGFTPRQVSLMEPRIRQVVRQLLDAVAPVGECDWVREVAAEIPLQVIAELMGIPMEDRGDVFDWSNRLIGFDDPEFQTSIEDAREAAAQMWFYANELAERRKGTEGRDLIRVLTNAEVDGEKLTEMEFDSFFLMLSVAGNETTRNAIAGGLLAFLEHPEQWRRLQQDPTLIDTAVEEIVRWVTPVMYFRRTATKDVEIRGRTLKKGQKLAMFYPSANRDEDVFGDGDDFDIGRSPNDHIAFGIGEHFCLGASLARLEIRVLFEELVQRLPDIELAGEVHRLRSNFVNGIKTMPVKFSPRGDRQ